MSSRVAGAVVRRIVSTPKAPAAIGPYSQAVVVDHTAYISGQIGMNPETKELVSDSVVDQTKQVLTNLGHILDAAGSSFAKVVKTTVLLADIKDYKTVNDIYSQYFTEREPARAAYQAAALPKGAKIEIEAIAIVGKLKDE